MRLKLLDPRFTVCKVPKLSADLLDVPFCFWSRTDEEISLVCPENLTPDDVIAAESGWRAMRIEGVLDFGLVGILARIAGALAEHQIPVFVVSTFNTDYILLKEDKLSDALSVLQTSGYEI